MKEHWLICRIEDGNIQVIKEVESKDLANAWVLGEGFGSYYVIPAFFIRED